MSRVPDRKLGSMVIGSMGYFHLLINGVFWGYNPLILTFDPNFQRDMQAESMFLLFLSGVLSGEPAVRTFGVYSRNCSDSMVKKVLKIQAKIH